MNVGATQGREITRLVGGPKKLVLMFLDPASG